MVVRIVLWDLDGSNTTIDELREYLREESVDAFSTLKGLRFKGWISDRETNRWGAVYLWESREAATQTLPSRAREIIGKDPEWARTYELEASIEGRFEDGELSRLGLAFA